MSTYFEAVVLATSQAALTRLLAGLPELEEPDPFAPITLTVSRVARGRYVVFGRRAGADRPRCAQAMEDLADELSLELGTAVAVHYDDQVGVRAAMLSRDGEPVRYFGEPDEVWVPYGEAGRAQEQRGGDVGLLRDRCRRSRPKALGGGVGMACLPDLDREFLHWFPGQQVPRLRSGYTAQTADLRFDTALLLLVSLN